MYFLRAGSACRGQELIFTGRKVDADEALALGIVDRKTSADKLVADAQAWASDVSQGSATALALSSDPEPELRAAGPAGLARGSQAQGICHEQRTPRIGQAFCQDPRHAKE
jgi:enoyl-CoA hydratase/carnithine racemase